MTDLNSRVLKALDSIRPGLQADGGDVELIRIDEDGKVPRVEFVPPVFVPYEIPPKPLNLDKVDFSFPGIFQIEGTVFLELWIDEEGVVRNVILVKSLQHAYDKVAIEGAKKLRFSPAIQRDKPVAVRYSFPVRFKLE